MGNQQGTPEDEEKAGMVFKHVLLSMVHSMSYMGKQMKKREKSAVPCKICKKHTYEDQKFACYNCIEIERRKKREESAIICKTCNAKTYPDEIVTAYYNARYYNNVTKCARCQVKFPCATCDAYRFACGQYNYCLDCVKDDEYVIDKSSKIIRLKIPYNEPGKCGHCMEKVAKRNRQKCNMCQASMCMQYFSHPHWVDVNEPRHHKQICRNCTDELPKELLKHLDKDTAKLVIDFSGFAFPGKRKSEK